MIFVFILCFLYSILLQSFVDVVSGSVTVSSNSSCVQAASIPPVQTPCVPLQYNSYCSKKGVLLDHFVFVKSNTQKENDNKLNQFQGKLNKLKLYGVSLSGKCEKAINIVYCHHYFPRCDGTGDSYKAQKVCKETCQYYTNACSQELKMMKSLPGGSSSVDITNCAKFSSRNAGETPECYYFDERNDKKAPLNPDGTKIVKDCLDENGRNYQGNISVTSSGIQCQSWTAQCPHRHTMVSTYPELKNASNYCRNPRDSGQRPWCFTSDKNKRWEYCDIPSCLSAITPERTSLAPTKTTITALKTVFTTTTTDSATLPTKIIPTTDTTKSVCLPSDPLPAIKPPCIRLNESSAAYCKKHGVKLDSYVFKNSDGQHDASVILNRLSIAVVKVAPLYKGLKESKCFNVIITVFCHHYFPACDRTGGTTKEQKLCNATSDYFKKTCKKEVLAAQSLDILEVSNFVRTTFPTREAGKSPECWYYDGKHNETESSSKDFKNDCLYLDGRGYQGNISVTSSGIQCQSWTAQCPHRHTMVSTYPELKNASNYCRNPRGSGQQPWCFTSDKNKRWEYCDIPSNCLPVNGGIGNWTLSRGCNSTCGQGVEKWRRYCDAPAPRYGGTNCSLLGNSTEIRNCSNLPPCPINGNYGKWIRNSTCNVTCGDGFEIWIRKCNNPTPAYGGYNCSDLEKAEKLEPCAILCSNSKTGINDLKIGISAGVTPVVLVILVIFVVLGYRRIKRKYEPYATLRFDKIISMKPMENSEDCPEPDIVHPPTYANLNEDGEPLPGVCRGIISYQQPYVNVTSLNRPHYAKLQLFSSITLDWLRNAWGQVDELGKHVYDALFRGMELLLPYDKLKKPKLDSPRNPLGAIDENGDEVYDKFDRRPAVLIPEDCVPPISRVEIDMDEIKLKINH